MPSEFPLSITPQNDRLPNSEDESSAEMVARTQVGITGEQVKFSIWKKGETGCQCPDHQRLARRAKNEIKQALDGTIYPPFVYNRRPGGLSWDVKDVVATAERELRQK